jgi:molecular chaperone GrpE
MTTDESANVKSNAGSNEDPAKGDTQAASETETGERSGRMNAAKAFYRAMYAGEDVVPDDFGMKQPGGGARNDGPCQNCAHLEVQVTEAQLKATEMENLYKRMAADFENYRKRVDREREEFQQIGMQKGIEGILPALDDFERARQTLANVTDPKAVLESMTLVYNRFHKCLEGLGVKPMEVVGTPFDPRLHEPVQEIETNQFADGAVMHELRKGYEFRDKILRPTLVNVASNPSGVVEAPAPPAQAETESSASPAPEKTESQELSSKDTSDLPELFESLHKLEGGEDSSAQIDSAPSATASILASGRANEEKERETEESKEKQHPVGAAKKKGASSGSGGKGFTETADLPVFELGDSLTDVDLDEPQSSKEQKVYDISDVDTETT